MEHSKAIKICKIFSDSYTVQILKADESHKNLYTKSEHDFKTEQEADRFIKANKIKNNQILEKIIH